MTTYAVTDAGLELLKSTGLKHIIDAGIQNRRIPIPMTHMFDDELKQLCAEAIEKNKKKGYHNSRIKAIEKLMNTEGLMSPGDDFFVISGEATDSIIEEAEVRDYRKFGMETLSELDLLLGSYALEKDDDDSGGLSRKPYYWRYGGRKTIIDGDIHGDLHIKQIDVDPKINKNTIDGTTTVKLAGKLPINGICADYAYWPYLIGLALKYANIIKTDIPGLKNWRRFLSEQGIESEIRRPSSSSVYYEYFVTDYQEADIVRVKNGKARVKAGIFCSMNPNANRETFYIPTINEKNELEICANYENRNNKPYDLVPHGKHWPLMKFSGEDAEHIMKGAIHGIVTGQSRTRPEFLPLMFWEYEQIKKGKTWEEIREECYKLPGF